MMSNKTTYESRDIVKRYANLDYLQKPEETILDHLAPQLKHMKMLDIGVGGGRTTSYFAPLSAEYVGIDYSAAMIKACTTRFADAYKNTSFKVCDVRFMNAFLSSSFDFVLFSYNGIDSMSHEDRMMSLREIKRVMRKSGVFCFSTHNLGSIVNLRSSRAKSFPRLLYNIFVKNPLLTLLNENFDHLQKRRYCIIRDGTHRFRLKLYYIKPAEQIKQLADLRFTNTTIYHLSGKEIKEPSGFEGVTDHWLYYLCQAE